MSYEETGILTADQLKDKLPSNERFKKGPVAIIECVQRIPCDPCAGVCKLGAIKKKSLVDPPEVDYQQCVGCAECVSVCPGLAIFIVDMNYEKDEASLTIPFELLPSPKPEETYEALDREGKNVGQARIIATKIKKDRTMVVTVAVKKSLAMTVRNIRRKSQE